MANYIVQSGSLMLSPTDGKTDLKDVESPFFIGLVIPTCADVPHVFFLFYSTSTMGSHQLLRIPIPDVPHGTSFLQIYANILPLQEHVDAPEVHTPAVKRQPPNSCSHCTAA